MYQKNNYKPFKKKIVREKIENIEDFSKNKVLYTLSKPRSPQTIKFIEDLEDPWFVYVKTYKTKSGVITDSSMIIAKDVEDWMSHLLHLGYEVID
jgi:hypothetical protein